MADNQNLPNQGDGHSSAHHELEVRFLYFRQEFLPKHGTKLLVVLVAIVAIIFGVQQWQSRSKAAELALNENLGKAFNFVYENKSDSAAAALEALLNKSDASKLQQAKAALLLGNLQFQRKDFDGAAKSFERVIATAGDAELLRSAAEHGLATTAIEKKDYAKAAALLEAFVKAYGKRTGDLEERFTKEEPADAVVTVPDALWKLTLVYSELQKPEQAKASAEKLLKIYGNSRQATQAKKFLATL
jgi:TolA-binding protein